MRPSKVAVVGVPSAAGAAGPGLEQAPLALRQAGLLERLRGQGATVVNLSDLSRFSFAPDPSHPRARNAALVSCALATTIDEMTRALAEGFTIVLGGGCTVSTGVAAGARQALGAPVGVVWVDADAELNTPETTPSGLLDGMALAVALGRGEPECVAALGDALVRPEHAALVGYRALDAGEEGAIRALGLALSADEAAALGPADVAHRAIVTAAAAGGPIVVHADMSAGAALPPGDLQALVAALVASPRVAALSLCGFDPTRDPDRTGAAALVELLAAAVGARIRAGAARP